LGTLAERFGNLPTVEAPISATPLENRFGASPVKTTGGSSLTARFGEYVPPKVETKESILASPKDMSSIREMMVAEKDTYYKTASDEETYDAFMSHMRWMNTNEVTTAKTALHVYAADDKTKMAYGEAFKVYDRVGSLFENGGSWGDKAGAVKDYGQAILTSPSTWAGFIVGKAASKIGSTAVVAGMDKAIISAAETAAKEVAKKGGSQALQTSAKREVANAAVKGSVKRSVATAVAIEAPLANFQDTLYQDVMMDTGAQEEFSYMQNAVSTLLGGSGAITSFLAHKTFKGASGLTGAGEKIETGKKVRAEKAAKRITEDVKKSVARVSKDWTKLVEEGRGLDDNPALRDAVVSWFTDYKTEGGFGSILQKHGVAIEATDDKTFSKGLTDFALSLDQDSRDSLSEVFEPLGLTFPQVVQKFASVVNEAGYQNQSVSALAKFMKNYQNITISNRTAAQGVAEEMADIHNIKLKEKPAKITKESDVKVFEYLQSLWKRAVVSHPGTTVLNVKGWGLAMSGRALAETVQMSSLYGAAGVKTLMGSPTAGKTLGQANALMKNLGYMTRMAVDPFTTVEAFHKLLEQAPKKYQREVAQQFFQGADNRGAAAFGLNPEGFAVKNTEKLVGWAQTFSFVNAQDVMTKSFSGIKELDKQARLEHGMGIADLLDKGRSHEISDTAWEHAIKALQEDTFSKDFRGDKTFILGKLADISQQVSNTPVIGLLYPFGQFVNSVIDFGVRYSPLALVPISAKVFKSKLDKDLGEKVSQMLVGSTMIGLMAHREAGKEAEGLQWNEERDDTGAVYKVDNLFPWGLYNLLGRMSHGWSKGEGQNPDLWLALGQQLSFPAALGDLGSPQIVKDMGDYLNDPSTTEDDKNAFMSVIGYAVESVSGVAAGFTRPIDPINDFVGAYADAQGLVSDVNIDRKQAEGLDKTVQNFSRYTNTFFSLLIGEEDETGRKLYGVPKHSATQAGAVRTEDVGSSIFGTQYVQRRTSIDRLLGMVNKAPFKVDSFTSGNPQYDDFMNQNIQPILEREATQLMNNEMFKGLPMAMKMKQVDAMLKASKDEVLASLETSGKGGAGDRLLNERRKLLVLPKQDRIQAKKDLGITTPDHKLNETQIRIIKKKIQLNNEMFKKGVGF
jgi:hypothetical protein